MVNDEPQSPPPRLTPESVKALADQTIDAAVLPKKIPDADDLEGQKKAVVGALSHALLFATEMPVTTLQPFVEPVAEYVIALGLRQTEHIDPEAEAIKQPAWVVDGMRDKAVKLPEQPNPLTAEPVVARTAEAPKCPKKIAHHARAVRK